tara:strand:+ start:8683 stop:9984 length:1302 start_codon:yes stop_codon:yes gene_type:complete
MNKIIKTKVGDEINYFVNGKENHGVVTKMSATYVTVFKEDGKFYQVPLDETFFVKDIIVNKAWDDMSMEERTEQLQKARAYSPRLLSKAWNQMPQELKDVLTKVATGQGAVEPDYRQHYGNRKTTPSGTDTAQTRQDSAADARANHGRVNEMGVIQSGSSQQPVGKKPKTDLGATDKPTVQQPLKEHGQEVQTGTPPTGSAPKDLKLKKALGVLYELQKKGKLLAPIPKKQTTGNKKLMQREPAKDIKSPSEKFQQQANTPVGAPTVGGDNVYSDDGQNFYRLGQNQTGKGHGRGKVKVTGQGGKERKKPVFGAKKSATQRLLEQLKSDVEQGVYGNVAGRTTNGVSTDTKVDAPNDYEGQSHEAKPEQFKYEEKKPKVDDDHTTKAGEFVYTDNPEKYKTKSVKKIGVPESQHNTWGLRYATKEEIEKAKKD